MAEFSEENKTNGVYGGISYGGSTTPEQGNTEWIRQENSNNTNYAGASMGGINYGGTNAGTTFKKVDAGSLPVKPSVWTKIRSFLFKEIDLTAPIKVELTPYQQKVEDEINEFLHQEISFKGFWNLVFDGKK